MTKKDIFGDDIVETKEQDYESLLNKMNFPSREIRVGDRIKGEILSISKAETFVSTNGALDAIIPTPSILNEKGELKYKVGDLLEIVVTQIREESIKAKGADSRSSDSEIDNLEDAFDMEIPLEGRVLESVKGGFRVQIQSYRAFCPLGQMDLKSIINPEEYVNKKFEFLITQLDEKMNNIVVSRRKLLELIRADREGEVISKFKEGDLIEGHVTRMEPFGAFVEVAPLVEGLVHISELSWARVRHPAEILEIGTPVRVRVIKIQEVDGRLHISLSLKQGGGEQDPWLQFVQLSPPGTRIKGTIEKKEVFGFFVKLATGVTGLLHNSKWRDSVESKDIERKRPGDQIEVEIAQIDREAHRISLQLPGEGEDQSWKNHVSDSKNQSFGTFAALFREQRAKK